MTDPRDIALPQPTRVGQGTAIEQSRAVAEVYAAIMVARQVPRNVQAAINAMTTACGTTELADRAFFSFPRGGSTIAGASVYLARELARCWGNIQYGVSELRRDDEHGQSEMQAFAWDLESNARAATIFIVPHKRDKKSGPEKLTDMRDIYENNANAGARRVRECIFSVLPSWFVEQGKARCTRTLQDGGGKPLAQQVAECLAAFHPLGVTEADLARKVDRPAADWTPLELGQLRVLYGSLSRNEVTREEAFPPAVVSGAEIRQGAATVTPAAAQRPEPGSPADVQQVMQTITPTTWHAEGHPGEQGRRAFDPECAVCIEADDALKGKEHFCGHTVEFVDGCGWCDRDLAWKREAASGEPS